MLRTYATIHLLTYSFIQDVISINSPCCTVGRIVFLLLLYLVVLFVVSSVFSFGHEEDIIDDFFPLRFVVVPVFIDRFILIVLLILLIILHLLLLFLLLLLNLIVLFLLLLLASHGPTPLRRVL